MTTTQILSTSPWHDGEIALQRSAGVADRMADVGRRVIRDFMPDQHRAFFAQLPFVVLGSVDAQGDVWATLRANKPGFMHSPDPRSLSVNLARDPGDPADAGFGNGAAIGLLGIELHTRRRNRMNGTIRRESETQFTIDVGQSYGNCPQYIQLRQFEFTRVPDRFQPVETVQHLDTLDARATEMISRADTFFVASYVDLPDGGRQVDVSHRGGKPGFVHLSEAGVLTVPDFAGNLFFNTLGNFSVNPRAGLVFVDFATGDLLQISGVPEVVLEGPEIAAFQGAERFWRVRPTSIVYRPAGSPLRWSDDAEGASRNSLMTGDWAEMQARLKAQALAKQWRPFRIAEIKQESASVRSFYLEPLDGFGLIAHEAGQHLPIRVTLPGAEQPLIRTYTLSAAPSDGCYRISVKRQGKVSAHLHELRAGDTLDVRAPAGTFTIDAQERRPAVLMAAGIGITPMLAMLRHIVFEGWRKRRIRPTWLFYAARNLEDRAFDAEINALLVQGQGSVRLVRVLSDTDGARERQDYDVAGRIDMALLSATLPFGDYDFYLCGPGPFMQAVYDGLRDLNISNTRIHAEAFGPASLTRVADAGTPAMVLGAPSKESVPVAFIASGKEARWSPDNGSLLDLAESRGLNPPFSCRSGTCGSCRTKVVEGAVTYHTAPSAEIAEDEALICCAVPAEGTSRLHLEL
ncbi:pyridoxamine 5'-phosphate oxidase family protein [Dongia sp.]|uniref:2Fe-2S iron-sulfur cluster-binding protein n=1 Tax=Dongia sp. TaxID=1977262 RepID=UPI0035AE4C0A